MARKVVMIVDDDDFVRDFLEDIIRIFLPDARIAKAKNGKEAADKLETYNQSFLPDVVLTDFEMPVMNGLELLRFIRSHTNPRISNLRVVMISGNSSPALLANAADLDCQYLEKPIRLEELSLALSDLLKK